MKQLFLFFLFLFFGIFLFNGALAAEVKLGEVYIISEITNIFKQNTIVDLKISCINTNNTYCDNETSCNITIFKPNLDLLINNKQMTYNPTFFNYTLNSSETSTLGEYSVTVSCIKIASGFSSFNYLITESGGSALPIGVGLALLFIGIAGIFAFLAISFRENKAFSYLFLLLCILVFPFSLYIAKTSETSAVMQNLLGTLYTISMWIVGIVFLFLLISFISFALNEARLKKQKEEE